MRIYIAGVVFLLASSLSAFDLIETAQTFGERAWMSEYIPESTVETIPLTEYDEFEVVELLNAMTPEDLEAALSEGYPMPWLDEILKDESIPWEDRYWLDCRIRAAIAQDLHIFFNREGNPIHLDASYIGPGEDYWRENMMVNPLGETDVPDEERPTRAFGEPGYILNLYGEKVGEIAEVNRSVGLSRDASIAAVVSGGRSFEYSLGPYACFMYPDGSFKEESFEISGDYETIVSNDGEVVVFQCEAPDGRYDVYTHEPTGIIGDIYLYDPDGTLIQSVSPPVIFSADERLKISSDNRYICDPLCTGALFLIDCGDDFSTNLIEDTSEQGRGLSVFNFSPDGNYLCIGGFTTGFIVNLNAMNTVWQSSETYMGTSDLIRVDCSNSANCIATSTRRIGHPEWLYELNIYIDNELVYSDSSEGRFNEETVVSPNGHFLLSRSDDPGINKTSLPTVIRQIRGE